jgi:Tfp pilus assembly major pilin PilA
MFCTSCGTAAAPGDAFCTGCGKPIAAASTSGAGSTGVSLDKRLSVDAPSPGNAAPLYQPAAATALGIPDGVKGWSWGAFLLNWIWAIGNRTWIGLLAIIPYVGVIVAIWLGIKGREMAWKNREWESVEQFNHVQKKWSRWAVGILIGSFVIGVVAAIAIPAYQGYTRRAQEKALEAAMADTHMQEQVAEAIQAPVAPAVAPAVAASAAAEGGAIDSNDSALPATLTTVAGTLGRATGADNNRFVTLNGNALFSGEDANWQFPMRVFKLSQGREAILMASSGGRGNSCETLFFFLLADGSGMRTTPEFGTCSPQGSFTQQGDVITLVLPKMGGMSNYVLADGAVSEDGRAVTMVESNDPSK